MSKVIITDHNFPSIDLQKQIVTSAGFELEEIKPICKTEDDIIRTSLTASVRIRGVLGCFLPRLDLRKRLRERRFRDFGVVVGLQTQPPAV